MNSKGFDLWSNNYDKDVGLSEEQNSYPFAGYKDTLNYIYNFIKNKDQANILDIGFGTAVLSKKLYDEKYNITGIDFSPKMIEIAKSKMENAWLIESDFSLGIPKELDNKKFDFIISTYAIHHLKDNQKIKFINSLLDNLTEDGYILIGDIGFETRDLLTECKEKFIDIWDDEEKYIVYDEIKKRIKSNNTWFYKISFCSGILIIRK